MSTAEQPHFALTASALDNSEHSRASTASAGRLASHSQVSLKLISEVEGCNKLKHYLVTYAITRPDELKSRQHAV